MTRLFFKKTGLEFICLLLLLIPFKIFGHSTPPEKIRGDGKIQLYNYHLNEWKEIGFRKNEKLIPEGIEKINHLLRSRDESGAHAIDISLIDLLDFIQDHFQVDTVEIISGYRSKIFNEDLFKRGHRVSPASLHIQGMAMDIHLDEIREETLKNFLITLKAGGVGFYPDLDFVHIDKGPFRYWAESQKPRKLIGVLNPEALAQLTSNQNEYLPNTFPRFSWSFKEGASLKQIQNLQLQRFWRGEWIACNAKIPFEKQFILHPASIQCPKEITRIDGKYRLTFKMEESDELLSSNEFYLKRE